MQSHKTYLFIVLASLLTLIGCNGTEVEHDAHSEMQKSTKRGVSFNFTLPEDLPLLSPSCSWAYNWGNTQNSIAALWFDSNEMDFCPMAWNNSFNADQIREYVQAHPSTKYLLGFNEPNLSDQCNMTPTQAAQYWPQVVALAKELNLKLVSPAMNYGTLSGYSDPIKWLDEFFAIDGISLDDIDAIAIHCYMASASGLQGFVDRFEKYGKPIWMTEFCAWENTISSVQNQMDYMSQVLNYMEQNDNIQRYAWFMPRTNGKVDSYPYMQLLSHTSPVELTDLGIIFTEFSSFDKQAWLPLASGIPAYKYVALSNNATTLRLDPNKVPYVYNLQAGCSIDYQVNATTTNPLKISYATFSNCEAAIYIDDKLQGVVSLSRTGTIDVFSEVETDITLSKGLHTLRFELQKGAICLSKLSNE